MQAAYALTRLVLFGFGWSIAAGLALAADELLPGAKWPVLAILAPAPPPRATEPEAEASAYC